MMHVLCRYLKAPKRVKRSVTSRLLALARDCRGTGRRQMLPGLKLDPGQPKLRTLSFL
jgi:hypothetical protein